MKMANQILTIDECTGGCDLPGGGGSCGALTKTFSDIYFKESQITYYDVVLKVREDLADKEFTQNPCLECCSGKAKRRFIC